VTVAAVTVDEMSFSKRQGPMVHSGSVENCADLGTATFLRQSASECLTKKDSSGVQTILLQTEGEDGLHLDADHWQRP